MARIAFFSLIIFLISGCKKSPDTLFALLPSEKTGIDFSNTIYESDSFNIFEYDYIYNGGGVAVADFNNDGLQDVFFTGNMVANKLYLNNGAMNFKDVSEQAKIGAEDKWSSGVVVVDINNDGWQDLYVCATKYEDSLQRANMLFLNKGLNADNIPVFEEVASKYGIADTGHSLMASFFDYDLDGDLDLYVLTNQKSNVSSTSYRQKVVDGSSPTTDRLYRNNGDETFSNVSREAGILIEGFGLGLAVADFNADGWPDLYVSNDFITNDVLYINNKNGTFTNQSPRSLTHQSQSSMGSDAADFNNDGLIDIVTMDMLPETNERKKTSINDKSYLTYINNSRFNYEHQYMRNMLHVNNGLNAGIRFSEVGQLSGVFQTEWSWSALFADFDNDGLKDLVITNGFPKDITDKDFVKYRTDVGRYMSNTMLLDSVPVVKIPNYAYKNNGGLSFSDVTKDWGFTTPSFSNGAAFVDLDNDGDLDYVVNNINDKAFVYENKLYSKEKVSSHYIRLKLKGSSKNKEGLGAKVSLYYDSGKLQFTEHQTVHGYLSSVESILHFGLGSATKVDSIKVVWQDGNEQKFLNLTSDQLISIEYDPSKFVKSFNTSGSSVQFLKEVSKEIGLVYRHNEEDRIDFNIQRTLPHKFTQFGPGISVGDINNDQLEDIVIGGSSGFSTSFFIQGKDGSFLKSSMYKENVKLEEDEGLLLFDADNDNDLDLYIVSGSIEHEPGSKQYQDRLYINNGSAGFVLDSEALPSILSSGSCVRAADFDSDGDLDLFVGGRVVPGSYPLPANSYLLRNDKGKFTNVIDSICPELSTIGMVTDALFSDFNNDGKPDIVVVGEFMQISFFLNKNGHFSKAENTGIENYFGWWNSITAGDFDKDGDVDYVVGNLGLNNPYQITKEFPLKIYAKDFDQNKSIDAIMACYIKESLSNDSKKLYPIHFWDELNSQSPRFRKQFSGYKQYGKSTLENMLSKDETSDALILEVNYVESSYVENLGNGKFAIKALPQSTQISPINGMVSDDFNKDGNLDVLMVGNDFGNEVFAGRYDAFTGLLLLGSGNGDFKVSISSENGFYVPGDAKALAKLSTPQADLFIATQNLDSVKVFRAVAPSSEFELSPESLDSWAELIFSDGRKQKVEFYYGSGYLSQSTRRIRIAKNVKEIIVYDSKGKSRKIVPSGI